MTSPSLAERGRRVRAAIRRFISRTRGLALDAAAAGWRQARGFLAATDGSVGPTAGRRSGLSARVPDSFWRLLGIKTLDGYILRLVLRPLAVTILIALSALLLERLVRLLDLMVNSAGPVGTILQMLVNLVPHYVGIAVPAALFVSVLVAVMRLVRDSELDALRASGVGLRRIMRPIMGLAAVLTVIVAITYIFLQPYTRYAYRELVYTVTNQAVQAALARGSNFVEVDDKTIHVDERGANGTAYRGVFIHQVEDGGRINMVTARTGRLLRDSAELRLFLRLRNGEQTEISRDGTKAQVVKFEQLDLPLDEAFVGAFRARGKDERELTLFEIWRLMDNPPPGVAFGQLNSEFHARLVRIAMLPLLPLLAAPLGVASRRSNRGIGVVVGVLFLILTHHVLQLGESLVQLERIPAWLGLWTPLAVFGLLSFWAFHAVSAHPGANLVESLTDHLDSLWRRIRRKPPAGAEVT